MTTDRNAGNLAVRELRRCITVSFQPYRHREHHPSGAGELQGYSSGWTRLIYFHSGDCPWVR